MSGDLYTELAWLPRPPQDLATRIREASDSDAPGLALQESASFGLDENGLSRVARAIARARKQGRSLAPLVPFRLGVLGNGTLDLLLPALVASAARYGISLECITPPYGQTIQAALDPGSDINASKPDAVLLALDYRALPFQVPLGGADAGVGASLAFVQAVRDGLRQHSSALSIVQTLALPPESLFGSFDRIVPGTARRSFDEFNNALAASVADSGDILFDVAALAETVGLGRWHSPAEWNLAKLPFADEYVPIYADHVGRLIAALRGKSRRCLILDLDNTVWGGVIGDDGLDGIRVAQGDAVGEAHLAVQKMALDLRERGVVIAVSSKNNDETARLPFQKHPEMLLREHHIAVFQANWTDKATNIRSIAQELSLGLSSMVFLDDNPAERALVRQHLPEVAVPELPDDPALYARTLAAAGYFEAIAFSDEDRKRAGFYQDNARRITLQKATGDLGAYLQSLDMEITFQPFDDIGRARITQLINKSNQFNLTTRRYTEDEVKQAQEAADVFTLQVRLTDTFGDNGMISVVICRTQADGSWDIDTWLMSCRVLGRGVEKMVLAEILSNAKASKARHVTGRYIPTERNDLVRDHYAKLGFIRLSEEAGTTVWTIETDEADPVVTSNATMRVKRPEAGEAA